MSKMSKEELEKIPAEQRWAIAGANFVGAYTALGMFVQPLLGKEKMQEISNNLWAEGGKMSYPMIKEALNIPVEDAIGGYKVVAAVAAIQAGGTFEDEMLEVTPERVVWNTVNCPWWDTSQQFGEKPENMTCPGGHQAICEAGLKALNPNFTFKLTKAMPNGDPVCQNVIEFKK
jgi:hypothetical protein